MMTDPKDPAPTTSPLRLLILSLTPSSSTADTTPLHIPSLLAALTGSIVPPEQISSGFAGYTTHAPLQLRTKYYNASIGIWCDEVGTEWKDMMTDVTDEAREVRSAIGAVCVALNMADVGNKELMARALDLVEQVEEVRVMCEDEGDGKEVVGVVILVGETAEDKVDEVEEGLRDDRGVFGWEVVGWDDRTLDEAPNQELSRPGKNEYGEKVGIGRFQEVLEAVPWTTSAVDGADVDFPGSDDEVDWTTSEQRELDREMMGLKMDLRDEEDNILPEDEEFGEDEWPGPQGGSEDVKVEQLQGLMERLIATREAASEMGGTEKQQFARREVEKIMKELG